MKILLDECITKKLKISLSEYNVFTVFEMGWSGFKNGNLMKIAIDNSFDIFITIDKNIEYQQNIKNYDISIVIFDTLKSKIENLNIFIPKFKESIFIFEKGKSYKISE